MKLYHSSSSPPSRSVLMTFRNLQLKVDVNILDLMSGDQLKDDFVQLNPMHQVPFLVDGDFKLSESRAIMAYLGNSQKQESSFYPNESKARALVDQRLYYDATVVFPSLADILCPMFYKQEYEVPAEKLMTLKTTLENLNTFLNGSKWFAGDNPTIADISILSSLIQIQSAGVQFTNYPNIASWFEQCKTLRGFEENLAGGSVVVGFFKANGIPPINIH